MPCRLEYKLYYNTWLVVHCTLQIAQHIALLSYQQIYLLQIWLFVVLSNIAVYHVQQCLTSSSISSSISGLNQPNIISESPNNHENFIATINKLFEKTLFWPGKKIPEIQKNPSRHLPAQSWRRYVVFIVNFEHISHLVLMFLLLTLNM